MTKRTWSLLLAAGALALGTVVVVSSTRATSPRPRPVAARADVSGVVRVVSATPFVLERPWTHVWRREAPEFRAGWLLVLEVDPARVEPRQTAEPVLYAGAETVERVNHGHESGRVVAILPSALGRDGRPALDLATVPFFFGAPELPERIDARAARAELATALRQGVAPLPVPKADELLVLPSRDELDPVAAQLVLDHSPAEADRALGMMAPRVK